MRSPHRALGARKPVTVAVVGDLHVREKELEGSDGQLVILGRAREAIISAGPDLVLVAGDLAGVRVPHRATTAERNALVGFIGSIRAAEIPVVVCRGNHDPLGEFEFLTLGTYYIEGEPRVVNVAGLRVAVLPWRDRSEFPRDVDYQVAWREDLAGFWKSQVSADLVLTHAAVSGCLVRPGQPKLQTEDPKITMENLAPPGCCKAVFAGHYHHHQQMPGGTPGWYAGGLFYNEFGEPGPKGWLLWNSASPGVAVLNTVPQPRRVAIEIDVTTGEVIGVPDDVRALGDAHVRVSLSHDGNPKSEAAVAGLVDEIRGCAASFDLQRRLTAPSAVRDGSIGVSKASGPAEKLAAWVATLAPPPDKKTVARAVKLLEGF